MHVEINQWNTREPCNSPNYICRYDIGQMEDGQTIQ